MRSFRQRIVGAVVRRARHARERLSGRRRDLLAPRGMESLLASLAATTSPALLGASISTLCDYGLRHEAIAAGAKLIARQLTGGAFPETCGAVASLWDAGHALEGLLSLESRLDFPGWQDCDLSVNRMALQRGIQSAAQNLATSIDAAGRFVCDPATASFHAFLPEGALLVCLPPLVAASRRCHEPAWRAAAERALSTMLRERDLTRWNTPTHWLVERIEALLNLGQERLAKQLSTRLAGAQTRGGDLPATSDAAWTSSAGLAQMATIWYREGQTRRANDALECVAKHQLSSGGFPGSWGRGARLQPHDAWPWTAKHILDAARLQVAARFSGDCDHLPNDLAHDDFRLVAIVEQLRNVQPLRRVVDAGCGSGRFLAKLQLHFPDAEFIGIDPSPSMLSRLPRGVVPLAGDLLQLPLETGSVDAVLAVESLEHSLLPKQAVAEMCRVLRPGGLAIVVDKDLAARALSERDPWEQWFRPQQVCDWLAEHCDDASTTALPGDLFHLWTGRRRVAQERRAAA